jgi:hypothetical protein
MIPIKDKRGQRRGWKAPLTTAVVAGLLATTGMTASAASSDDQSTIAVTSDSGRSGGESTPLATAEPVPVAGFSQPDGAGEQLFDGTFTLTRFKEKGGTLYAVGRLEGQMSDGRAVNKQVSIPVQGATSDASEAGGFAAAAAPCSILTLNLAPIDLNLLGLHVFLDEVNLLIEAIPGAGALLGNLLCAITGLLDPGGILGGGPLAGLLTAITDLLNGILGGL